LDLLRAGCLACAPILGAVGTLGFVVLLICLYRAAMLWRGFTVLRDRVWQAAATISLGTKMKMVGDPLDCIPGPNRRSAPTADERALRTSGR
jgi:hypothetical protein